MADVASHRSRTATSRRLRRFRRRVRRVAGGRSAIGLALIVGAVVVAASSLTATGAIDVRTASSTGERGTASSGAAGAAVAGAQTSGGPGAEAAAKGGGGGKPTGPDFEPVIYQNGVPTTTLQVTGGKARNVSVELQSSGNTAGFSVRLHKQGGSVCLEPYNAVIQLGDVVANGDSDTWEFRTHNGSGCRGGPIEPTRTRTVNFAGPASG